MPIIQIGSMKGKAFAAFTLYLDMFFYGLWLFVLQKKIVKLLIVRGFTK
ncbi:hypothetical protein ACOT8F_06450 [Metabacillus sp. RGM 3146]